MSNREIDMIIDCGRCTARGAACAHCAVTCAVTFAGAGAVTPVTEAAPARPRTPPAAAGSPPVIELDAAELRALTALANAGLIPPLRYAPAMAKAS